MGVKRTEFENRTQGYIGVVKVNRKGDPEGKPVEPGKRVFLTDEEIELTEQAVSQSDLSPFTVREIVHRDPHTGDETDRFRSAPLSKVEQPAPSGSTRSRSTTSRRKRSSG